MTAVSTASRDDSGEVAREKTEAVCRWLAQHGINILFKKIDSTLRGNVGVETQVVMENCGFVQAAVNPAFPALGRTLEEGRLHVHGIEPSPPLDLPSLLSAQAGLVIDDAANEGDLSRIARKALDNDPPRLLVGSAGLAKETAALLATRYGRKPPSEPDYPEARRPLVFVVGTIHDVTKAQVVRLLESHAAIEVAAERLSVSDFDKAASQQTHVLLRVPLKRFNETALGGLVNGIEAGRVGGLVVTGGDTALLTCSALKTEAIHLRGEVAPGIPWGVIAGGAADGLPIVTKGGGFGDAGALARAAECLSAWRAPHVA